MSANELTKDMSAEIDVEIEDLTKSIKLLVQYAHCSTLILGEKEVRRINNMLAERLQRDLLLSDLTRQSTLYYFTAGASYILQTLKDSAIEAKDKIAAGLGPFSETPKGV